MKRLLIIVASLLWGAALFAQQALVPGTGIISPEINPDNTVTFRYYKHKGKKTLYSPGYATACCMLLEVGSAANTLAEAESAARFAALAFCALLKNQG